MRRPKILSRKDFIRIILILIFLCIGVVLFALHSGVMDIPFAQVVEAVRKMIGRPVAMDEAIYQVIIHIRLKRIALAFLVGMSLALSGCVFQALLRNPLADPHILGASAGGALGAVLASATGMAAFLNAYIGVPLFSFGGSLAAISLVYVLSKRKGYLSMYSLILVGVILNSFFISIVIFIETIVSADQLASIFFWLLGNLSHYDERLLRVFAITFLISFIVLMRQAKNINVLSLGEEKAAQLGVSVEWTKRICFVCASIITGMAVALSGLIGFVGLVVPHIMRLILGPDHRLLLPASALGGGMFLVLADTIARTAVIPQELPVGVVTSFVGAPFFIFLLKRKEGRGLF
jgi:iron complex transport system permease protein